MESHSNSMVPNHQPDSNLPPFDPSSSPHRHVTQRGCDSTWRWQVWAHSSLRQGGELNLTLVVSTCSTQKWTSWRSWSMKNSGSTRFLTIKHWPFKWFSQLWPSTMGDQGDYSASFSRHSDSWRSTSSGICGKRAYPLVNVYITMERSTIF